MTSTPQVPGMPEPVSSKEDTMSAHRSTTPHDPADASQNPQVTRRAGLRLAATGAAGLAGLAGAASASAAPAHKGGHGHGDHGHSSGGRTPKAGERAHVKVTATTLWVDPRTNREGIDDGAVSTPVDLDAWNAKMPDEETRKWLTGKLESQAVLGSEVIVDEIDGEWAHIVVTAQGTPRDDRGYPGWVPVDHLTVDERFARLARCASTATVTALTSTLTSPSRGEGARLPVSFDTILPVTGQNEDSIEVAVPDAGTMQLSIEDAAVRAHGEKPPRPTVEDIIATGERFLGLRYLWAGVSAYGYDCSGYTYTLFHHHGITLERDAGDQMHESGLQSVEREDLQRGDLVFFATEPGAESIRHVALYVGDDQIMQAPNAARSVEVVSLTEYDTDGEYAGARRVELAKG
ncbi:NlpC/P60 family protein [Brachybacterium kimchii]|uniref:NlpC/P60 family protein n=1 Tax=Brachybacterium kimchii TaxID=2942909 RepID=A0ABY4N3L8_9MICO|nr:NlpC/P60 family protein [Brachybacterium kimchii]UQN29143.1 NlpC/P60 family protein [Brachybacterium kimchii]